MNHLLGLLLIHVTTHCVNIYKNVSFEFFGLLSFFMSKMFINGAKIQMNVARFARYETFLFDFQTPYSC